ncbi:hypothetical protein KQX54_001803 [Cotesia glomerata]|uniref:Uncharacterized protein n=1 Tax=Cotesia glomerata TaxID=32391 RepID=A0AAV7IKZ8_COTGL|nr:hypothetical protein KQX54_001803 [Cotesia glomerata]
MKVLGKYKEKSIDQASQKKCKWENESSNCNSDGDDNDSVIQHSSKKRKERSGSYDINNNSSTCEIANKISTPSTSKPKKTTQKINAFVDKISECELLNDSQAFIRLCSDPLRASGSTPPLGNPESTGPQFLCSERLLQHYLSLRLQRLPVPPANFAILEADFPGSSPTKHSQSIQASPTITLWPERPRASSADESS